MVEKFMTVQERAIIDGFHDLYYNGTQAEGPIFKRTYWMNVPCYKCPLDLWIYQELIAELRPDLIVETGTYQGGSALFMAHMLDIVGRGQIVTIDIAECPRPSHPRIRYVKGSSADAQLIDSVFREHAGGIHLVILDSDHSQEHVSKELSLLAPHVNVGSYIIVEDTNVNGHPTLCDHGNGPYEAVQGFLKSNPEFVVDQSREKFLMTFNPMGFLKRIAL
jgi:cephalosporin hydroxylase